MSVAESFSLRGKTALITGAAKRIGKAASLALAGEGVNIVGQYLTSSSGAEDLSKQLESMGVRCRMLQASLSKRDEYELLFKRAIEASGPIDILINNASIFPPGTLNDATLQELNRNIEINAWVPLILIREFARQTEKGSIINILDTRVKGYYSRHFAYHLSKMMLREITKIAALELAPGITVNAVAPGLILPPPGKDESYLEGLIDTVPLKMHGNTTSVTDAILFLLKSPFITGQVIFVDGGRHLRGNEVC